MGDLGAISISSGCAGEQCLEFAIERIEVCLEPLEICVYRPVLAHLADAVGGDDISGSPKEFPRKLKRTIKGSVRSPALPQSKPVSAGPGDQSSPVPPLPSFVFTLAATCTTLSISMFSSAEYIVWRAVWNSLVGSITAFALRAAPALWGGRAIEVRR